MPDASLEGWAPEMPDAAARAAIVDRAFDYRGDVTIACTDGREITGYVYNRDAEAADPYVQLYAPDGASHTIRYADIAAIRFTGKDMAAGRSYEAWLERKAATER